MGFSALKIAHCGVLLPFLNEVNYLSRTFLQNRSELRQLLTLALPAIVEQLLETLVQYVDTAMVGQLGEAATAAVSVTSTINWLVASIFSSVGIAAVTMISRSVGAGKLCHTRQIAAQFFWLTLGCGVGEGILAVALSPYLPIWMGAEEAIQGMASQYFWIISLPMVFRAANYIFGAELRATGDARTPMAVNLIANLLNILLNALLIYQVGLGVIGAALASAASYLFSGTAMFLASRRNRHLRWSLDQLRPNRAILGSSLRLTLPVMAASITSCLGYVVFAALVSGMGTTIFAAHSIAVTAETIFYIPGYGLRSATSTMVGQSLGEGNRSRFDTICRESIVVTVVMMCCTGVLLFATALPLMRLFTPSEAVAQLGARMLRLVAFSEPFFGLMVVVEGVFYGLGRTRYAFWVETGSMWGVRILFSYLCVRVWGLDLQAVWLCMIADNVCKALLFTCPVASSRRRDALFAPRSSFSGKGEKTQKNA